MRTKRVLVCAPRMPEYDREGGSRRVFHLIEMLRASGWSVTFLARYATQSERYMRKLRQMGVIVYAGEESALMGDEYLLRLDEVVTAGKFDLAILAFWEIAERYVSIIRTSAPQTRIIIDSIDLHFLRHARKAVRRFPNSPVTGLLDTTYADEMIRELNIYAQADAVLTVSEKEATLLADFLGDALPIIPVPLLEDVTSAALTASERQGIVFLANFRHPPNIEAFGFLCEQILPAVDAHVFVQHPVYVVGNDAHTVAHMIGKGQRSFVQVVGWVPLVEPYLQRSRVSVVPVLHGAGTKTKLIQALTVGTPSVSTTIGAEGLDLRDGEDVLIADTPVAFAAAIAQLLIDDALWVRIATQGRERIGRTHSREAVRTQFFATLATVMRETRGSALHS